MSAPKKTSPVVGIIFSKDRPLQLDALLKSFARHCADAGAVRLQVLFTVSSELQKALYRQVMREHPAVQFISERNFQQDLLGLLPEWEQVLFLVDDNVFVRPFKLAELAATLRQQPDALGFSLRLGRNTSYCYMADRSQKPPRFEMLGAAALKYRWPEGDLDFGYPLEVSSSLYRVSDLRPRLEKLSFNNPNTLEKVLADQAADFRQSHPFLLCSPESLGFCLPLNRVQQVWANRSSTRPDYSSETLACQFVDGWRIDIATLDGFTPIGCHQEVELKFLAAAPRLLLVSVVIPCYKQAQFLPEAVESVVQQTLTAWELIIVNDGSPDNTSDVARELIARYPDRTIRLLEKPNGGVADARNAGIRAANAEYFLPLDADDRIAPTYLRKAIAILGSRPEVGFVYSHIQHFGMQNDLYRLPEFDPETIVYTDNIVSVCALVRRVAWEQAGGYVTGTTEGDAYAAWDFWVGCIEKGWQGYRIPEPLFLDCKKQASMLGESNDKRERQVARIVLNHRELYSQERVLRAAFLLQEGKVANASRILLVCTHFWPSIGGLETIVENLGARLVKRGHQVTVATLRHPDRSFSQYRGMEIISLEPDQVQQKKWPGFHPQLAELAAAGSYGACVLFSDPLNWVFWSLEKMAMPTSTRVIAQPIINADGYSQWENKKDFRLRLTHLLRRFHSVVAISTGGQEVKFLRAEHISFVYIPNAAEAGRPDSTFRRRFNIPEGKPLFLHVANLWRVKNHLGLMRALSLLPGEWQLVMIGHPSEDTAYVQQVREMAAGDCRFLLIPGLPRNEIATAMAAADVVLLASLGEVSSVTILEAMSHGKPWVATPECGAVHDNAGGLVVPLERFPETLQKLTTEPDTARKLGRLGQEHWKACFGWDRVAAAWEQVILTGQTAETFEMPPWLRESMWAIRQDFERTEPILAETGPKVSVIVPTFNRPQMLVEALNSILKQTFQDFEIIVVNDAGTSVDGVVDGLDAQGRITYLTRQTHRGAAAARNAGLRAARGKYVAYLDDDDIFLPDHLETLVQFLETTHRTVAYTDAFCAFQEPLAEGGYVVSSRTVLYSADWDADRILYQNFVPTLCFMHKRTCLITVGGFDESLTTHEDWDLWIRLSQRYEMAHIKQVTCEFRRRSDATSMTGAQFPDFGRTMKLIHKKYRALAEGKPHVLRCQGEMLAALPPCDALEQRSLPNSFIRKVVGRKLRRSMRKRLATVSLWFED